MPVKRMGGKGGATRTNATSSWGKQKADGRWEVEVARQEAGMHPEYERWRQRDNQPNKRHGRPWRDERQWRDESRRCWQMGGGGVRRGNATTSQTRGMGGHGMARGDVAMRGRDASRSEAAA